MFECRKLALSLSAPSSRACGTEMLLGTGAPVAAAPPEISACAHEAGEAAQSPAKMNVAAQARGWEWVRRMSVSPRLLFRSTEAKDSLARPSPRGECGHGRPSMTRDGLATGRVFRDCKGIDNRAHCLPICSLRCSIRARPPTR